MLRLFFKIMTTNTFPLSGYFYGKLEENYILVSYAPADWIVHSLQTFNVSPYSKRIGSYVLDAFYIEKQSGLKEPTLEKVNDIFKIFNAPLNEPSLNQLVLNIQTNRAVLKIAHPLCITLEIGPQFLPEVLTNRTITLINISKQIQFIPQTIPTVNKICDLVRLFNNPDKALETYQSDAFHGTSKQISKTLIKKVGIYFRQKMGEIHQFSQTTEAMLIRKIDDEITVLIQNDAHKVILYSLFNKYCWKGGYKKVFLTAKIDHQISPIGISVTDDKKDFQKELLFRTKPELKPLMTTSHFKYRQGRNFYLGHGWACSGSLSSVNLDDISTDYRDSIALQLLQKMSVFHQYAVHKDLHTGNLLLDYDGASLQLFINDFGSSEMKEHPENMGSVITRSHNLAPEILKKVGPERSFQWSEPFSSDLSFEDWELCERFAIGQIILHLYLGYNPVFKTIDLSHLKSHYPLLNKSWKTLSKNINDHFENLFHLDSHLEPDDIHELSELYLKSFQVHQITQKPSFDEFVKDIHNKKTLFSLLSDEDKETVLTIYKDAHERMIDDYIIKSFALKAKAVCELSVPIDSLIKDMTLKIKKRIDAVITLCDLDPSKRPHLADIIIRLENAIKEKD